MGIRGKRGISHIEVILAFIIFIAAVSGIFYFFNPAKSQSLKESTLSSLGSNLMSQESAELIEYVIDVQKEGGNNGEKNLDVQLSGDFPQGIPEDKQVLAAYYGYQKTLKWNINYQTADIYIKAEELGNAFGNNKKALLYLYLSDGIDRDKTSYDVSVSGTNSEFDFISSSTRNVLSEKKIKAIPEDREAFRRKFGIPKDMNFKFELKLEGNQAPIKRETESAGPGANDEVFAETKRVEVLREDGKIEFADLRMDAW